MKENYVLLKDLPDAKSGTIISYEHCGYCYSVRVNDENNMAMGIYKHALTDRNVENNPEWFMKESEWKKKNEVKNGTAYFDLGIRTKKWTKQDFEKYTNMSEKEHDEFTKELTDYFIEKLLLKQMYSKPTELESVPEAKLWQEKYYRLSELFDSKVGELNELMQKFVVESKKHNWISLKDKLPTLNERVIVFVESQKSIVISELKNDSKYGIVWNDDNTDGFHKVETVSYWQPLLQIPE
jgi:hypothetical protein